MRIRVDLDACQGYACCMMEAPAIFDLDDGGKAVVLLEEPSEELRELVDKSVRGCPARAIVVEQG